jgi:hypothetical protein
VTLRQFKIRALIEAGLFLCLFAAFLWEARGNYFCTESGRMIRQSLNVAAIMTSWDTVAAVCGLSAARSLRGGASNATAALWISGIVAALGYSCAMLILPPGGQLGTSRFPLDCSCFFTEGYGMMFPIIWVPILVIATVAREWLTQRLASKKALDE